jgi:DNA polymerase-3 subunit gamma/tau
MSYQVLARKWRPKSFDTLVGQKSAVQALSNALDQNRLHHAYIFNGTRGIGKTTIARILAKSLNCDTGITSKPCLKCPACTEIDVGRYVDLIELDAASNTGVDNMIELLENAQYAPASGRFKIYIIDEVHMLSKSAFNAMLKTLEEPPEHVKFILATTEIQKVPVTVLSRCLQFNLRQMTVEDITNHLKHILNEEKIEAEDEALQIIAKASNGSMRDSLSILDQAIAFSQSKVSVEKVIQMLGTIDDEILFKIIECLIEENGVGLNKLAREMDANNISFEGALNDLAKLFHELTVCKIVPDHLKNSSKIDLYQKLANELTAESLQLFYQICIHGKKDLYLAPDPITGFNMTLLRMLAFYPTSNLGTPSQENIKKNDEKSHEKKSQSNEPLPLKSENEENKNKTTNIELTEAKQENNNITFDGDWSALVNQLKNGVAKSLAQECQFIELQDNTFHLSIDESKTHLSRGHYSEKLEEVLINHFNKKIKVIITVDKISTSPALEKRAQKAELMENIESAIMQDSLVKELISDFNAEIIPSSIEPIKKGK